MNSGVPIAIYQNDSIILSIRPNTRYLLPIPHIAIYSQSKNMLCMLI
jgi:hypothetical protein